MGGFLDYVPGNSLLHRLNPLTKLLISLLLCVSCFLTNSHWAVLGIIGVNLTLAALAGVLPRSLRMLRSLGKLSFLFFVVQILFVREGRVLLQLPLHLVITDKGLLFSLLFVLRLLAATMPLALMLSVTQMSDLSNVLVNDLKIPYKYTFALTTAIRFIPIFSAEMHAIMEAQTARGVEFDTRNFFKKLRLLLPLCVPLLISSVKKIDGGAISAELRGFNCRQNRKSYKNYGFRFLDAGACFMAAGLLAVTVLL